MMLDLLDTNTLSALLDEDPAVLDRFWQADRSRARICVINQSEMSFMAERSAQPEYNHRLIEDFLRQFRLLPLDVETAREHAALKAGLLKRFVPNFTRGDPQAELQRLNLLENDLWIAATAIRHGATLVSSDGDFQRIAEARPFAIEAWWKPVV